jgi:hypothetical protein
MLSLQTFDILTGMKLVPQGNLPAARTMAAFLHCQ